MKIWIILLFVLLFITNQVESFDASSDKLLSVVSVITNESNDKYQRLKTLAASHNIKVTSLLSTEHIGHGVGFGMKVKMLHDYVYTRPDNELVLFVDGYDVLITAKSVNEIISRYQRVTKYSMKALFSAEVYCWPDGNKSSEYPITKTPFKYLNSGTFIAPVITLKRLFALSPLPTKRKDLLRLDDQRYYTELFLGKGRDYMALDVDCHLFMCLSGATKYVTTHSVNVNDWMNTETKTYPIIFHANGGPEIKSFLFDKMFPLKTMV